MKHETVRYDHAGKSYESIAVWDDAVGGKRPTILIAPTFRGPSPFETDKAEKLAAMGYAAFVIDIFGTAVRPTDADEATAAMTTLNDDRIALAAMMAAALDAARGLEVADADNVAAIGFCFGGKCVLDLARQGAALAGVVTFHGVLDAPGIPVADAIPAKVLVLHGWDDPLAKPDMVVAFAAEMTAKAADWQLHAYGHAQHGFTNYNRPEAYEPKADRRSWQAMTNFLAELF